MLTEKTYVDRIEVLEDGFIQIRQVTKIFKDDKELSKSYHRWTIAPGQDYSDQEPRIKAICDAVHTPEVIEAYQQKFSEVNLTE